MATAALFAADAPRRRVEIEAHRGESHDAPENTMASFRLGWERGDDACELDVHLSKDGQLVVSHDADTKRVGSEALVIKDHTLAELRRVDVGTWKGEKFAGERLPTLDEVLATIPAGKRLFIEIKIGPEAVPPVAEALKRAGKAPEQTVIISFNAESIRAARKQIPHVKAFWLASLKQDKQTKVWGPPVAELIAKAKEIGANGLDVSFKPPVDAAFVKAVHEAGLECYVWTVDDPAQARALVAAGVEGITTNRAAWLREQLEK